MLLDFVPNHASTESEYFTKSVASDPQYKDFFVWADPITDPSDPNIRLLPSNWVRTYFFVYVFFQFINHKLNINKNRITQIQGFS